MIKDEPDTTFSTKSKAETPLVKYELIHNGFKCYIQINLYQPCIYTHYLISVINPLFNEMKNIEQSKSLQYLSFAPKKSSQTRLVSRPQQFISPSSLPYCYNIFRVIKFENVTRQGNAAEGIDREGAGGGEPASACAAVVAQEADPAARAVERAEAPGRHGRGGGLPELRGPLPQRWHAGPAEADRARGRQAGDPGNREAVPFGDRQADPQPVAQEEEGRAQREAQEEGEDRALLPREQDQTLRLRHPHRGEARRLHPHRQGLRERQGLPRVRPPLPRRAPQGAARLRVHRHREGGQPHLLQELQRKSQGQLEQRYAAPVRLAAAGGVRGARPLAALRHLRLRGAGLGGRAGRGGGDAGGGGAAGLPREAQREQPDRAEHRGRPELLRKPQQAPRPSGQEHRMDLPQGVHVSRGCLPRRASRLTTRTG